MEYVYYANGKKVDIQEYIETMVKAKGNYKQDVVVAGDTIVHILIAPLPAPLSAA